jgi:Cellulase (glycosyl hydrolase family 5)
MTGSAFPVGSAQNGRWTESASREWYSRQPWLVGACYVPSYAVNELEMWQPETFDPERIETELTWAENLGFNTLRVFLHDLLWQGEPSAFLGRLEQFLDLARQHGMRVLFVLFDSCWDPEPRAGPQLAARPGVCMSRWVQSPGTRSLEDTARHGHLESYARGVVRAFAHDDRVLGWDVWNEPDHLPDHQTELAYGPAESKTKTALVAGLLPKAFEWVRAEGPCQPLTSAVWKGDWSSRDSLRPVERIQLELSDVISFHSYEPPAGFAQKVRWLQGFGRPILCTEYMARTEGSTFQGTLPIARAQGVAALNWGFVAGKTQGYLPWDSWERPYVGREPPLWFHEILRDDGRPYDPAETDFIREMVKDAPSGVLGGAPGTADRIRS